MVHKAQNIYYFVLHIKNKKSTFPEQAQLLNFSEAETKAGKDQVTF